MREIDFLPEWYKEGKRRRLHMRRQYVALAVVFLAMLIYNLTAEHRIARASARIAQLESRRTQAEDVMREFNQISRTLGAHKAKVDAIHRIDSRIDPGAVLAEISHVVNERVILSRVEFTAETVAQTEKKKPSGSAVRVAQKSNKPAKDGPLGDVRFHIVLTGVAIEPADVGTLVCRLDESAYFKRVYPSFSRPATLNIASMATGPSARDEMSPLAGGTKEMLQVTEFEISCYLANYEEISD